MRTWRLAAAVMVLAVFGSACSDSGSNDSQAEVEAGNEAPAEDPYGGGYAVPGDDTDAAALDPDCDADTQGGVQVEIEAVEYAFVPKCLEATADQASNVVNAGEEVHNVTLERILDDGSTAEVVDLGELDPGQNTAQEPFSSEGGPGAGTYRLYCKIHESAGMQSVIQVVDA